ncbi:MAG: hypothetical protein FWD17_10150 [Polyangiaceae bacterium]|nr:hypothetical protein [Polyangiaceae bacterium]
MPLRPRSPTRVVTRRASILHPAHPSLGNAAFALLGLGVALDALSTGRAGAITWLAFWALAAGVALGTWSAIFALFDWIFFASLGEAPGEAGLSGLGGFATALVVGLFGLAALSRVDSVAHAPPSVAIVLEMAGATLMWMRNWIGRELVREPRDP